MIRRSLYIFIAIILCLVVWWIGPLVSIGTYRPFASVWVRGIIIALLLAWALWPVVAICIGKIFYRIKAPKPEVQRLHQRDAISARFYDAIRTLKHVGLSKQKSSGQRFLYWFRRRYLSEKPWFLVIGPQGSGKTSLISESGKLFTLSQQYGFAQTADVGNTRDCNWWLTDDAVFIDTAGEWVQVEGQSENANKAQKLLFTLIRRYRRQPAIDGLVLCLDAAWLIEASLTDRKQLADTLRVRILEAASWFKSDICVYLAMNNIDSLPGGATFLAVIDDELLRKGFSISVVQDPRGAVDLLQSENAYVAFGESVSRYVQEILHISPLPGVRQELLFFTESVGALRKPLFSLIEQIFPHSPVGYAGQLRQLWLGSTQSLYLQQPLEGATGLEALEGKAVGSLYSPLLDSAILERGVLHSRRLPLRERTFRVVKFAVVFIILGILANVLFLRYLWETEYIAYITARFEETKRIVREIPETNFVSDDLISAYEQLGYMSAQLSPAENPLVNPYVEHRFINQVTEQTYHRHLFKFFWPALMRYITAELGKDITSNDADVYSTLKVYLMMGKPPHRSAQELESWFMMRWQSFAPQGYSEADKKLFSLHLREIFKESISKQAPTEKLNAELVRLARVKAMAIPVHVRVLRGLQAKVESAKIEDVTLANAAGANVSLLLRRKSQSTVTDTGVPGFYTQASYHDVFLPKLEGAVKSMIFEESWVLRDDENTEGILSSLTSQQKLQDETYKLYFLEYADHWERFLKDIRVRPVSGLDDAALLARQFSDPSSPLANLLRFTTKQTGLTGSDRKDVSGWFEKKRADINTAQRDLVGEISGERTRYRVTPEKSLEQRFDAVRRLGQQLNNANGSNADPLARSFEEIYNQLSTLAISLRAGEVMPQNSALNRLLISAARQPEPVRSIMQDLLDIGNNQSVTQSRNNLNNSAAAFASDVCRNVVAGKYPFSRKAREEVGVGDFARMFGPNGTIKQYVNENLASYVDVSSGRWRVKPGSQELLGGGTLRAFENASHISDTFFSDNRESMAFSMYLRPVSLSPNIMEAVLDIDGQVIRYSHGSSQPVNISWPGKNGGAYVRLSFKDMNGRMETVSFNGPWALFRLYDNSNPIAIGSDRRELTMAISSIEGAFKIELQSTVKDFPLWSKALRQFSCPSVKSR